MTLQVVPYTLIENQIVTCASLDYEIGQYEFGIFMAASRAIAEWLNIKTYTNDE